MERVQLMAKCQHVFHAACIKTLLQSQFERFLDETTSFPCPMCRGDVTATSMSQVPVRERPLAVTLEAAWFHRPSSDVDADGSRLCDIAALATVEGVSSNGTAQTCRVPLRLALSSPVHHKSDDADAGKVRELLRRCITAPVTHAIEKDSE